MNPKHHIRSDRGNQQGKKPSAVSGFVEINMHKNIALRSEYLYLEDVKTAININTLEERIILKRWLIRQLQKNVSKEYLIQALFDSSDKNRHTLQKHFRITLK